MGVSAKLVSFDFGARTSRGLCGKVHALDALSGEARRLERAAWIGLTAVFAAVLGAWVMGYALERPILRQAQATAAIRNLDLATDVSIEGIAPDRGCLREPRSCCALHPSEPFGELRFERRAVRRILSLSIRIWQASGLNHVRRARRRR